MQVNSVVLKVLSVHASVRSRRVLDPGSSEPNCPCIQICVIKEHYTRGVAGVTRRSQLNQKNHKEDHIQAANDVLPGISIS